MRTGRLLVFAAMTLPAIGLADTPVDFSGEWVVAGGEQASHANPAGSGPHHGGDRSGGGGHGMGGGMGGGGMGGGHGMGGGGRHHSTSNGAVADASGSGASAVVGDPRLSAHALTIRQSDVVFDIAADGKRAAYRFDNRNNYGAAYGGTVNLSWAAPEMIIETHPDAGGSIEEHYSVSDDGKKLTLRVHEQRAGSDTAHDVTREFVRDGAAGSTAQTLP